MKCVRCGSEMNETDRCCLKCGAINYNNPLNKQFVENYAPEKEMEKANPSLSKKKNNILKILLTIGIILGAVIIIGKLIR